MQKRKGQSAAGIFCRLQVKIVIKIGEPMTLKVSVVPRRKLLDVGNHIAVRELP